VFYRNVGGVDRVLRLALGAVLFVAGLFLIAGKGSPGKIVVVVGALALLTGIFRFCVLYLPFGISTAYPEAKRSKPGCGCAACGPATPRTSQKSAPAGHSHR
jgi:hypothetical protein